MNIVLNGEKIDLDLEWPLTWGKFFQQLMQGCHHFPRDHGIVRLVVDGIDSLSLISDGTDKPVAESIKKIEIFTTDSVSIVRLGFERAAALIDGIKQETDNTISLYREDKKGEASAKVSKIMDAFKSIVTFINSAGFNFHIDFEKTMFDQTRTLRQRLDLIGETLHEMVELQKKKDFNAIADLLEGKFMHDLTDWQAMINILLKEIEAGAKQD